MAALVDWGNRALTAGFDVFCLPFRGLSPIGALAAISCAFGVFLVWLFGRLSDQDRIREVRDRIRGNLIGVRLFRRDVAVVLRLQGRILRDTLRFLRLAAVPMLILAAPSVLVAAQLHLRFAVRPIEPGATAVVTATVREPAALDRPIALVAAEGVTVETPPVRIRATREVAWRVRVERAGRHALRVHVGAETIEKALVSGTDWGPVPQTRTGQGPLAALFHPGEPPIPVDHAIEMVEVACTPLDLRLLGLQVDWLVAFLVLSMTTGLACKRLLGVEI